MVKTVALKTYYYRNMLLACVMASLAFGCAQEPADEVEPSQPAKPADEVSLTDAEAEDIVRRSYQYVAMYNVNNKGALATDNPMSTQGWNRIKANTRLTDHTLQIIARPNNDTLYVNAALDLRGEPMVLEVPAIDSKYMSLMVTGYDHYVNVPMATRLGDFSKPSRILLYSAHTPGYAGEPVEGVDEILETTGDFVSAVYRVMPHANDPERFERIAETLQQIV